MERKAIYKDGRNTYRLILGTTKFGVMLAYLTDIQNVYDGISGVKIDDIGYVCIDRVIYIPWAKFFCKDYTLYRKLSDREYSAIVFAISQFMLGDIDTYSGMFMYRDEIEAENIENNNTNIEVAPVITETTESVTVETKTTINKKVETIPTVNLNPNRTDFVKTSEDMIDIAKSFDIPVDEIKEESNSTSKYFDLLATEPKISYYPSRSKGSKRSSSKNSSSATSRHLFSEDEALAICMMNKNAVMSKYNVKSDTAHLMIRNAKRAFGFENRNVERKKEFVRLFEMGYNVEDVAKNTNTDINIVKGNYERYSLKASDNRPVIEKWDFIIKSANIDLMLDVACNLNAVEFCKREKCSYYTGINIICKIRDFLNLNPLLCAGFEKLAFDKDALESYINNARNGNRGIDKSVVFVYDKTMSLYDAYTKCYNDHADILAGIKDIPEYVPIEDRDYFMCLLYNRFHPNRLYSKNRVLNNHQKDLASRNASIGEFAMEFMTSYNKAINIKNKMRSNKK